MGFDKNININVDDCKSCKHMATITVSPTLITDKEVTYDLHKHSSADYSELYTEIEKAILESKAYTDERVEVVLGDIDDGDNCFCERVKYEVVFKPTGTLVDYRDKEVRIMCPEDTVWTKQTVGVNGDTSRYYIGFRAYAPEDAVSFKESLAETITDNTMYYFENNDFAGVDEYGRKYSIVWLPVAVYDEATGIWTYYGSKSAEDKLIGWYYSVEWYNENGIVVESDCIRINLSNESCYTTIEPSYATEIVEEANTYTDEQIQKILESVDDVTDEDIESLFM